MPPVPLAETLAELLDDVSPVAQVDVVKIAEAAGRILAEALTARIDLPPWDNSAMDGYAVRCADAGSRVPVTARIAAGDDPDPLEPATAARIFTGAPMPPGANTVVMQEDVSESEGHVELPGQLLAGQHVRPKGQECARGAQLLEQGRRLRPQDTGLLASQGLTEVAVRRRLRVALLSTGSELVSGGARLRRGQLYNSNGPMLTALLASLGCEVACVDLVRDSAAATREALQAASSKADLVLSTGGVSVGDADHVRGAVEALGRLTLWRVAVKPGKPFASGDIGAAKFMGLPGNPASAFVTFLLLARPWIRVRQGCSEKTGPMLVARADFERDGSASREEYLRVRLQGRPLGRELAGFDAVDTADALEANSKNGATDGATLEAPWATPFSNQSSGILRSISSADALARVPAGLAVRHGDSVQILPLDLYAR